MLDRRIIEEIELKMALDRLKDDKEFMNDINAWFYLVENKIVGRSIKITDTQKLSFKVGE